MGKWVDSIRKLTAILRQHVWCMFFFAALLLFWFAAFTHAGKGSEIASWLSIALAIVVIVYTLIQGFQSQDNLTKMSDNLLQMESLVAKGQVETSESMSKMLERIEGFAPSPPQKTEPHLPPEKAPFTFTALNSRILCLFVLYCAVQSWKQRKNMSLRDIFLILFPPPNSKGQELVGHILEGTALGVLIGLECVAGLNFFIVKRFGEIEIKNLPPNFCEHITEELNRRIEHTPKTKYENYIEASRRKMDAYFDGLPSSNV